MPTKAPASRMVITIKEINRKLKRDGTTPFWNVVDDGGDFYSVFKPDIEARLLLGKANAVMLEASEVGGKTYRNIVGIADPNEPADIDEIIPGGKEVASVHAPISAPAPVAKDLTIDIRSTALSLAVTLAAGNLIPASKVESQANEFVKYIQTGKTEHINSSGSTDVDYIAGE